MNRHLTTTVALAATAAFALGACGGGPSSGQTSGQTSGGGTSFSATPAKGGVVEVLQKADFSYLDPARGWDGGVNNFYRLVYRTLTTSAPGNAKDPNAIVPDLATGLGKQSDGGKTWTYTLKQGLKFDDGTPITSAEVKFGISRAWDPEIGIGSPYAKQVIAAPADYRGPYRSGDLPTIETPDPQTIVFHLKKPFPEFDAVVGQVNMTPFPKGSGAGDSFLKKIIASGPYKLASYTPGSVIQLERNPNWDPKTDDVRTAEPDGWRFTMGLDGATIDERLMAGQGADVNAISGTIQASTLPRLQSPQLKDRTLRMSGICTTYMSLNTTKKPLDDLRVRQAISFAVDKAAVQNATGGTQLATIATTTLPTTVAGHKDFDVYPSPGHKGDVEAAKKLLTEAGQSQGFPLVLDIRSDPKMQKQAEAIQQSLKRIGVDVQLNVIDSAKYYETIGTRSQQHDAAITGWCPDWASSAATFLPPLFYGPNILDKGNSNLAQLNAPAVNQQIEQIGAMTDLAAANKQWGDLDEQILKLAPIVPLNVEQAVYLPGSNVAGLFASPGAATGGIDYVLVGLRDPSKK
ncbi:ABC transporter substrate-binding protein [Terrabacter terrae]|uniref:ABC transporter substrate-binding protein n=1 Tax=Terrabacter terrae TaxID=318434 RepID=A0ABN2UBW7_9MICO